MQLHRELCVSPGGILRKALMASNKHVQLYFDIIHIYRPCQCV